VPANVCNVKARIIKAAKEEASSFFVLGRVELIETLHVDRVLDPGLTRDQDAQRGGTQGIGHVPSSHDKRFC
jgi:hypothetical protein